MANKQRHCYALPVPPKSCRVSFTDDNGIEHGIEVMAESLYEAAALGLALLKKSGWDVLGVGLQ